jgi:uncharacterized protein
MAGSNPQTWRLVVGLTIPAFLVGLLLFSVIGWRIIHTADSRRVHQAIDRGDVALVKELLDQEPARLEQRNGIHMTPLHTAAHRGRVKALEELVRRGADLNARWNAGSSDDGGWTALHIVAMQGHADAAGVLVGAGADVNALTKKGQTPLDIAARYRHEGVAALLSSRGGVRAADLRATVRP